ncbi:LysR substrate-binding domain-containing protein [Parahaliea mediterranea]|uniref:LysR substrate-binding domain-containing protein n=1 Tax=Parahaliea mediterranea TaxID=651086 RepID=UPI000E2F0C1B|nr:LysR substrate-binding domain-containing protein [Parahaliea mediterranea]
MNKHHDAKLPARKSIPPFEALRAFDAVARLGGIRKAAQALSRDHAVVSRHLRTLEDWTGTALIERTAAGAVLTEAGQRYHHQVGRAIDDIADATLELLKRSQDNSLQVWCMPALALHWLIGHLGEFEAAHPALDIELRSTHEQADLLRLEADVDIRLVPASEMPFQPAPGVQAVELARPPIIPVASPEYLASVAEVRSPQDLLGHELLHEEDFDTWRIWLAAHNITADELSGPRLWDGHMTLAAARQGRGISLTNPLVVADDLASGVLVEVGAGLPDFCAVHPWSYWFFARADRWDSPAIHRFRNWLTRTVNREMPPRDKPAG